MTIAASTRFGPYEILSPLGGGMGEVHRAQDTRLGRARSSWDYSPARSGKRFIVAATPEALERQRIVVLNWTASLKR